MLPVYFKEQIPGNILGPVSFKLTLYSFNTHIWVIDKVNNYAETWCQQTATICNPYGYNVILDTVILGQKIIFSPVFLTTKNLQIKYFIFS